MELKTRSPYPNDSSSHIVIARQCGCRGCRASTPCLLHDQVYVRLTVDGIDHPNEARLSKAGFLEMQDCFREPEVLFHELADAVLLANMKHETPPMAEALSPNP